MFFKSAFTAFLMLFSIFCSNADAQGTDFHDGSTYTKTMRKGQKITLGYMYQLYSDCRSAGDFRVYVKNQPQGGSVTVAQTMDFPTYPPTDDKYKCDKKKAHVTKVFYNSRREFTGRDDFGLQIVPAVGSPYVINMQVNVR